MKAISIALCCSVAALGAAYLSAGECAAQPQSPINTSVPASMIEESDFLVVVGSLIKITRKAAWPRLEMLTAAGETWMLELPSTVTLAWFQGHPQDLDDLKYGQWIKVLYTKAYGKKRVRSVQILPGFRDPSAQGAAGPGGQEPENALPKVPDIPTAPVILNNKSPRIPELPPVKTPEAPSIPEIPTIDTSRQPHR